MSFNSDNTADVGIHVETGDAAASIAQLSAKFDEFSKQIKDQFGGLGDTVAEATDKIKSFGAAFLSFEGLKKAVEVTLELGIEVEQLANRLGSTQAAASQFIVAMDDIHTSADAVTGIMQRQSRQLRSNEAALNDMKIATRDANKQFLPQEQILLNTVEALRQYKAGTDRNQAAIAAFGGRVGDLTAIMKLTPQVLEDARVKADALGLTMSQEGVEAVEKYRKGMNDLQDVIKAAWKIVGESLMPVLASMAEWFSDHGPAALAVFSLAVKSLVTGLDILWVGLQEIIGTLEHFVRQTIVISATMRDVLANALSPEKAKAAFAAGMESLLAEQQIYLEKMHKNVDEFQERNKNRWNETPATGKSGGNKSFNAFDKEAAAAALDAQKAMAQSGAAMEEEFLKQEVAAHRMAADEKATISREVLDRIYSYERELQNKKIALYRVGTPEYRKAMEERQKIDSQYAQDVLKSYGDIEAGVRIKVKEQEKLWEASLALELKAADGNLEEQLKIQQRYSDFIVSIKGVEQDKIQASQNKELGLIQQISEQKKKFATEDIGNEADHQNRLLEIQRDALDIQVQMGQLTVEEKLRLEQQFENESYTKKKAALEAEKAINANKVEEVRRLNAQIQALDDAHLKATAKNQGDTAIEIGRRWQGMFDAVENAFENAAKGIAAGTETLRDAMINMSNAIAGEFISLGVKMLASWIKTQLGMTLTTEEGVAQRNAIELWGAIKSIAIAAWSAIKQVAIWAWTAAAAAYQSIAAIPFVGWALAPAAAFAAAAAVLGFGKQIMSAEGGYDIPSGVNPMVQAHQREMILPAPLADTVRGLAAGSGSGSAGGIHFHGDVYGFEDFKDKVAKAMRAAARGFNPNLAAAASGR